MNECIFCNQHDLKLKNIYKYFFSTLDKFTVTEGHTLIITKRHISSYFDLTKE